MYVSNVIADSFKIWHPGERILISAGCGTGKTSFATGQFAEHARRHGQSILYLSPRKALRHSLVSRRSQRGVCYRTYQAIEQELLDGRNPLAGYSYIICDEAHYFTSDSSFNSATEESWRARACAIEGAVRAGVPYEDMVIEALGLAPDSDRQGDESKDRLEEARKWLDCHAGQAVDTAELAEILSIKAKGHRGYAKSLKILNAAIVGLGYRIVPTRAGQKRLRVVQRITQQAGQVTA